LADQMEMFAPVMSQASAAGFPIRGYVSMCFGDPWEGSVDPSQVVDVCLALRDGGCGEISLGDTIGVATPGGVRRLIGLLVARGIPLEAIGVHFHDTYGQALSNTLAALDVGVTTVDASAGGIGGCPYAESATGNLATEDVVWMLDGLRIESGVDLGRLVETSAWLAGHLGRPVLSRVGQALG
jgi:hydroxymethylglutaryl-CoA lyase